MGEVADISYTPVRSNTINNYNSFTVICQCFFGNKLKNQNLVHKFISIFCDEQLIWITRFGKFIYNKFILLKDFQQS